MFLKELLNCAFFRRCLLDLMVVSRRCMITESRDDWRTINTEEGFTYGEEHLLCTASEFDGDWMS
ncbi:hypothetical protein ABH892_000767 [Paenibacillus sp. RC254]